MLRMSHERVRGENDLLLLRGGDCRLLELRLRLLLLLGLLLLPLLRLGGLGHPSLCERLLLLQRVERAWQELLLGLLLLRRCLRLSLRRSLRLSLRLQLLLRWRRLLWPRVMRRLLRR